MTPTEMATLTDHEIAVLQQDLANVHQRRMRIESFPGQLRMVILDARTSEEIPDVTIREIFEGAMAEVVTPNPTKETA